MISFTCPNCQHELQIPDQYAGQRGACNKCQEPITVPLPGATAASGMPDDLAAALDASLNTERPKPVVRKESLGDKIGPLAKPVAMGLGMLVVAVILVAGVANLPKLSLGGGPSPSVVTEGMIKASSSGNMADLQPFLTAKAWEKLGGGVAMGGMAMAGDFPKPESYTLGAEVINGNEAQVPVQVTQLGMTVKQDVLLRKESAGWRIYAMRVEPMPGMKMTIDFENPEAMVNEMQKMMGNMSPEMMKGMEDAMRQQMAQ